MTLKLSNLLFEEQNPKKLHKLFEEAEGGDSKSEIDTDDVQKLNKATLEKFARQMALKLNTALKVPPKVDIEKVGKEEGATDLNKIKNLSKITLPGKLEFNPIQPKGPQKDGIGGQVDFDFYKKSQIIPFFINNNDGSNIGAGNDKEEFIAVFYMPMLHALIDKENEPLHQTFFGLDPIEEDQKYIHLGIKKLHYELISNTSLDILQKALKNSDDGMFKKLEIEARKNLPKATKTEKQSGESQEDDSKKDQGDKPESKANVQDSVSRVNLNKLHEHSLSSLLYEKKLESQETLNEKKASASDVLDLEKITKATQQTDHTKAVVVGIDDFNKETEMTGTNALRNAQRALISGKETKVMQDAGIIPPKDWNTGDNWKNSSGMSGDIRIRFPDTAPTGGTLQRAIKSNIDGIPQDPSNSFDNFNESNKTKIINAILNNTFLDAKKLLKSLPNIKYNGNLEYTGTTGNDLNLIQTQATLSLTPNQAKFRCNEFNFNVKSEEDFTKVYSNKSSGMITRRTTFNFSVFENMPAVFRNITGAPVVKRIKFLVDNFNNETKDDSEIVRASKAANYFVMIVNHYGRDDFLNFNVDSEYQAVAGTNISQEPTRGFASEAVATNQDSENKKQYIRDIKDLIDLDSNLTTDFSGLGLDSSASSTGWGVPAIITSVNNVFTQLRNFTEHSDSSGTTRFEGIDGTTVQADLVDVQRAIQQDFILASGFTEEAQVQELFDHYGTGTKIIEKIFKILQDTINGKTQHVALSGDQVQKLGKIETRKGLLKAITEGIDSELKQMAPLLTREFNHNSPEILASEVIDEIKSAIADRKDITIDLDDLLEKQIKNKNLDSIINMNEILRRMKEDKADLDAFIEVMDEETFEEDLIKEMTRLVAAGIQGILGNNASLLNANHNIEGELLNERGGFTKAVSAVALAGLGIKVAAFFGVAVGVPVWFPYVTAVSGTLALAGMWKEWGIFKKKYSDYAEAVDMFSERIIEKSKPFIAASVKSMISGLFINILVGVEEELNKCGITLKHQKEAVTNIINNSKADFERTQKQKNLNNTGKKIYAEIINGAYKTTSSSKIGQFVNQSSIENMLINSLFGSSHHPRNNLTVLMDYLQKEETPENSGKNIVYKNLGLKYLLAEANEGGEPEIKHTVKINMLRKQLCDIITKEYGTSNFRSDVTRALNKELKKIATKSGNQQWFSKRSTRVKASKKALQKALGNVFGLSKKQVNSMFKDDFEELFDEMGFRFTWLGESKNSKSDNILLENSKRKGTKHLRRSVSKRVIKEDKYIKALRNGSLSVLLEREVPQVKATDQVIGIFRSKIPDGVTVVGNDYSLLPHYMQTNSPEMGKRLIQFYVDKNGEFDANKNFGIITTKKLEDVDFISSDDDAIKIINSINADYHTGIGDSGKVASEMGIAGLHINNRDEYIQILSSVAKDPGLNMPSNIDGLSTTLSDEFLKANAESIAELPGPTKQLFDCLASGEKFDSAMLMPGEKALPPEIVKAYEEFKDGATNVINQLFPTHIPPSGAPIVSSEPIGANETIVASLKVKDMDQDQFSDLVSTLSPDNEKYAGILGKFAADSKAIELSLNDSIGEMTPSQLISYAGELERNGVDLAELKGNVQGFANHMAKSYLEQGAGFDYNKAVDSYVYGVGKISKLTDTEAGIIIRDIMPSLDTSALNADQLEILGNSFLSVEDVRDMSFEEAQEFIKEFAQDPNVQDAVEKVANAPAEGSTEALIDMISDKVSSFTSSVQTSLEDLANLQKFANQTAEEISKQVSDLIDSTTNASPEQTSELSDAITRCLKDESAMSQMSGSSLSKCIQNTFDQMYNSDSPPTTLNNEIILNNAKEAVQSTENANLEAPEVIQSSDGTDLICIGNDDAGQSLYTEVENACTIENGDGTLSYSVEPTKMETAKIHVKDDSGNLTSSPASEKVEKVTPTAHKTATSEEIPSVSDTDKLSDNVVKATVERTPDTDTTATDTTATDTTATDTPDTDTPDTDTTATDTSDTGSTDIDTDIDTTATDTSDIDTTATDTSDIESNLGDDYANDPTTQVTPVDDAANIVQIEGNSYIEIDGKTYYGIYRDTVEKDIVYVEKNDLLQGPVQRDGSTVLAPKDTDITYYTIKDGSLTEKTGITGKHELVSHPSGAEGISDIPKADDNVLTGIINKMPENLQDLWSGVQDAGKNLGDLALSADVLKSVSDFNTFILASKIFLWGLKRGNRKVLLGGHVSKMLQGVQWERLPAVQFTEVICRILIKYRKELSQQGILIEGTLDTPSLDEAAAEQDQIASKALSARIRQLNPDIFEDDEITEDQIRNVIESDLTNLCTSIIKRYDPSRHEKIINYADKATLDTVRDKMWVKWIRNITDDDLAKRAKSSDIKSNRQKAIQDEVKKEVEQLMNFILEVVKKEKGLFEESLFIGKLTKFLFEAPSKAKLTIDSLKDILRNRGILIYSSDCDLDEDSDEFKKAESRLLGTLASILENSFAMKVTGKESVKAENLKKVAVENAVKQDAPVGQPASPEVAAITETSGAPVDMNSKFDMNQMAGMVNMMGGNPMMMFMMMMMNPQFMQNMMNMQKQGATFGDAAKAVVEEDQKGEGQLSDFEKQLEAAIKTERQNLPTVSSKDIKRLHKELKTNKVIEKLPNIRRIEKRPDADDSQMFVAGIRSHVNITKKDVSGYDIDHINGLYNFIVTRYYNVSINNVDYKSAQSFARFEVLEYGIRTFVEKLLDTGFNESQNRRNNFITSINGINGNDINTDTLRKVVAGNNEKDVVDTLKSAGYSNAVNGIQIKDADEASRFIAAVNSAFDEAIDGITLTESVNRYNANILRKRPVKKKSNIINESEFLKKELKRLWKI